MTTTEQRMAALRIANETRLRNAQWKHSLSAMDPSKAARRLADTLEDDKLMASHVGTIPVAQALMAIRRIGPSKADRILVRAGIANGHRALRDIPERQRTCLVLRLRVIGRDWS